MATDDAALGDTASQQPLFLSESELREELVPHNYKFVSAQRSAREMRIDLERLLDTLNKLASVGITLVDLEAARAFADIMGLAVPNREVLAKGKTTVEFDEVTYTYYDDKRGTLVRDTKRTRELALELLKTAWGAKFVTRSRPVVYKVDTEELKKHLMDHEDHKGDITEASVMIVNKFKITERQTPEEIASGVKAHTTEAVLPES